MKTTIRGTVAPLGTKKQRLSPPSMPYRKGKGRTIGIINLDIFHLIVAVFISDEDRCKDMERFGFQPEPETRSFRGLAVQSYDDQGHCFHAIVITPDGDDSTITHEASHIVDFLFDHLGIPGDMGSTELRAYLSSYLIERTRQMVLKNQIDYPQFYATAPEQAAS